MRTRRVRLWLGLLLLATSSQLLRQPAGVPARAGTLTPDRVAGWRAAQRPTGRLPSVAAESGSWIEVWATAYCPTCTVCDTGKITKSGRHAWSDGLAVAARGRKVAPLGSRIYVPRFGWLPVDDTGGGVQANQIDIRMRSHRKAVEFGRRKIKVRLAVR